MSEIFIGCSKCGEPLPVDSVVVRNALLLGEELTAAHDVCPGTEPVDILNPEVLRRFRCQLTMYEIPPDADGDLDWPVPLYRGNPVETMAATGVTAEARNFAEAVNGTITTWLNRTWPTMQESAAFADLPGATPATTA